MKINVLFVCLGNICRSPLAEGIFNALAAQRGVADRVLADSCGTGAWHVGEPPDPRTLACARLNNIPLDHVGRQFRRTDFERFDHILVMDTQNYTNVLSVAQSHAHKEKVKLLRTYDPIGLDDVPDPYYGGDEGFREVYEILYRSIENFIAHLEKNHFS